MDELGQSRLQDRNVAAAQPSQLHDINIATDQVRSLRARPDVVLADATGRDHPRRAGLALHLGAELDLPTVGVTHRPLLASGDWPGLERSARSPLVLDGEEVGAWLRVRRGARPLAVHAAWRTDSDAAVAVVVAHVCEEDRRP